MDPVTPNAARSVQGTAASWDAGTGAGRVLLDDGTPLDFDPAAWKRGGLHTLRAGQRVRVTLDGDRPHAVTLLTFPPVPTRPEPT